MSQPVHIEGMGVLGSLTAALLNSRGLPFTWSDNDSAVTAWQASTGLVYPTGDRTDLRGLADWRRLLAAGVIPARWVEDVTYGFTHKHPPHDGLYPVAADLGWLRIGAENALAVNVGRMVEETRALFESSRTLKAPAGAVVVKAHATPDRLNGYQWGWSAAVRLRLSPELEGLPQRPVLYGRTHRYNLTYAYPRPGTDQYLVGTASIRQTTPSSRMDRVPALFEAWKADARSILHAEVEELVELREGWRPQRPKTDSGVPERVGDVVSTPQLAGNGVRHGTLVASRVLGLLR